MDLQTQRLMEGAAGAGGSVTGIEDVFKIHLYEGTGDETNSNTGQDIVNGIDFSGDGGMVMIKRRDSSANNAIVDTERGAGKMLTPHNSAVSTVADLTGLKSFNNNGFSLGDESGGYQRCNMDGGKYLSYSFKKTKKFFDVVTYTGNGTAGKTVSHNLGSVPGMIVVKRATGSVYDDEPWQVYHRSVGDEDYLQLSETTVKTDNVNRWNDTSPTASVFSVGDYSGVNASGVTYVAYLFAHEEAEFGPNSDQKIISCGSYSGSGSSGKKITLPFEPGFIIYKNIDYAESWNMFDNMRGVVTSGNDERLRADNNTTGEDSYNYINFLSDGWEIMNDWGDSNASGQDYIYIAIAAETGKTMKAIETGSDVFAMDTGNSSSSIPSMDSGFAVDMAIYTQPASTSHNWLTARLIGQKEQKINGNDTEGSVSDSQWDSNVGWGENHNSNYQSWLWKRHAGFDVVTYTGNGTAGHQIPHSLSKTPEMIWTKKRNGAEHWAVGHKGLNGGTNPWNYGLSLNQTNAEGASSFYFYNTAPTSTHFTLGQGGELNANNDTYIALLFSSVKGVSHVGSYTGTGSAQTITIPNGGFQPRFLIIKLASTPSDGTLRSWYVFDTTRGWGSGNDQWLMLDSNSAQFAYDVGQPTSTGFTLADGTISFNGSGERYIYFAHA